MTNELEPKDEEKRIVHIHKINIDWIGIIVVIGFFVFMILSAIKG